jgi:FkbM family methyltransferase
VELKTNRWYQFFFDYALGIRTSRIPKFRGVVSRIYKGIAKKQRRKRLHDIYVRFKFKGSDLLVNTTHMLPFTLTTNKLYSSNLPRICKYVADRSGNLSVIDIGANIGDTVFLIKQEIDCPVLCIEGNPDYLLLLKENIQRYDNVELEQCFVGTEDAVLSGNIVTDGNGTSFVEKKEGATNSYVFKSLETIVEAHPGFKEAKVLKIDTDGYDCEIIRNNLGFISRGKPILFFEYAPAWIPAGKDSEFKIFDLLAKAGYSKFIFYYGDGELHSFSGIHNDESALSMHEYFARTRRYGDIVAIHHQDADIYEMIKEKELKFMRSFFE